MNGMEYAELQHCLGYIEGIINAGDIDPDLRDSIQEQLNGIDEAISCIYKRWEEKT